MKEQPIWQATFWLSMVQYIRILLSIHERNALREVLPQQVGKFLYQTSIAL